MNTTLGLVSIQYALALLIGQDLDLRNMLRKFLPPALRLLNCRSGYIWLYESESDEGAGLEPCYSYPALKIPLVERLPEVAKHLKNIQANGGKIDKAGEVIPAKEGHFHFLSIGSVGLLVLQRDPPLPKSHLLALAPVLQRLETACQACLQHAYVEIARQEALHAKEIAEKAHSEALRAKEIAEQASKAKSDFLAMISHEIRTPMNGIIGLTDLMLYSEVSPSQQEYLGMIKSSSGALLDIINEILDFSRIEAGTLRLAVAPFRLRELIQDTFVPLAVRAEEKSLVFHWEIAPDIPDTLDGDAGRLRQVMINLVGNAIKFTERGEVTVSITQQSGAPEGQACLLFAVRDTGIGISPDKQSVIFQPFQQADNSISRHYGGTGLGLAISSQLIGMMGGGLQLESDLGNGSIFHFSAPFRKTIKPKAVAGSGNRYVLAQVEHPLEILLAEDNAVNRMLAVRLLNKVGHRVTVAENGQIALDSWAATRPDVILMDVQMPVMDGLESTRLIRQRELEKGVERTPIIALTANAMSSDRERCLQVGMDAFLSKPFNAQDLLDVLAQTCILASEQDQFVHSRKEVASVA